MAGFSVEPRQESPPGFLAAAGSVGRSQCGLSLWAGPTESLNKDSKRPTAQAGASRSSGRRRVFG